MSAKLTSRERSLKGKDLSFHQEITIGRDSQNKIFLNKEEISKKHARVFYDETKKCYFIEDLGSRNGTSIDDTRIHSKERLGHLHVITLAGKYDFIFQDISLCERRNPRHVKSTPAPPVNKAASAKKDFVSPAGLGKKKVEKLRPSAPVGGTVIADKAFVLPAGLGQKKGEEAAPASPVGGTVIADKSFVLPPDLAQKKEDELPPASPVGGTVIADKSFVLPPDLGQKKDEEAAPASPVGGTVIADKAFVLPPDLGQKKNEEAAPASPVGGTVIADKAFVLPAGLGQKKDEEAAPASPVGGTVIADKAFVLPAGLGQKKEDELAPALPVGGTVIADKAFVLPPSLGEEEKKEMRPELSEPDAREKFGLEPAPENLTQEIQSNLLDEEKTQVLISRKKRYFLEVSQEEGLERFPLVEGENVIGRKSICDLVIHSNQISRRHAVLTLKGGRFFIRDEQSKNKTLLEGKAIQKTVEIQIDAKIRFGKIKAKLILEEEA